MKYLKILGLAAVAAAALMAFAGAGTASADELCTEPANAENMCPAGKKITEIHATQVGSGFLKETGGASIVTCKEGTLLADITKGNETKVTGMSGPVTALIWKGCTFPTNTTLLGTLDASAGVKIDRNEKGEITAETPGTAVKATETQVTINTVLFGSCIYGAGAGLNLGTVPNGGTELGINAVVNKISGGVACPETSTWTATWKITNHNAVYYIKN